MAETLVELVARITADATELKKGLSEADDSLQSWGKNNAQTLKKAGLAVTAFGAVTTTVLGLSVKAAEEERQGIALLSAQLDNVGVSYDNVKDSLEGVIAATQAKTNFADDQQRQALGDLIIATGDYDRALELLPLALDLAAAKQMDVGTAAELLGKVAQGNVSVLTRYGIVLKDGATSAEALAAIQEKVAGAAEKTVSPFTVLTNTLSDLQETIGNVLLPIITDLVKKVSPIISSIQEWAERNPGLAKAILVVVGVVGVLAVVLGPILIMLPGIIALLPILGAAFAILMGPVGLVVLAIVALIAIGVLLVKNWDKIKAWAVEIWENIASFFSNIWHIIVGFFKENWDKILAILFPAIGIPILIARHWEQIVGFFSGLWGRVTSIFSAWGENVKSFFIGIWDNIKGIWENGINFLIGKINSVINLINKIPGVNIGNIGKIETQGKLPGLASGGIVTQPTLAMVGEAGPEAIIPLSELDEGSNRPIHNNLYLDGALFAQIVSKYLDREYRGQMT